MKQTPLALSILAALRRAIAWWAGELTPMLPGWVSRFFLGDHERIILRPGRNGLSVVACGSRAKVDTDIPWDSEEDAGRSPEALRKVRSLARTYVIDLDVPQDFVLEQEVVLPRAAAANLNSAISFGLATWSPFSYDEVYLAAKIKTANVQQIRVVLRYCLKTQVQPLIDRVGQVGFAPDRLILSDDHSWTVPVNKRKLRSLLSAKRLDALIFATAGALVLVLGGVLLHRQTLELDKLQNALRSNLESVRRDEAAERSLQVLEARRTIVVRRRSRETPTFEILAALGAALPSDAYLISVDISGSSGRIEVEGAAAPAILQTIRGVASLQHPEIDASPPGSPATIVFQIARVGK